MPPAPPRFRELNRKWAALRWIGVGEILVGVSSAADVETRYGMKYELINRRLFIQNGSTPTWGRFLLLPQG